MFCPKCGVESAPNGQFCHKCGAALPAVTPGENPVAPSAQPPSASSQSQQQPEAAKSFQWSTVLKFAAVGAVLALFVRPPPHLRNPVDAIALKVVGMFLWGFVGAIVGAIIGFFKRG